MWEKLWVISGGWRVLVCWSVFEENIRWVDLSGENGGCWVDYD